MMSANAPLGRPSRNTGSVDAVCTIATITGLVVSEVMTHAAVTSFIHIAMFAAKVASHRLRNTTVRNGAKVGLRFKASSSLGIGQA
jgi:hypothetical protein